MKFRIGLLIILIYLFSISTVSAAIYVPDDYAKIQWAVDNASVGETIVVRDGIYTENVDVDKELTIRSENGSASCTVKAVDPKDYVFEITADNIIISGFKIYGSATGWKAGIFLYCANNASITDNDVSTFEFGIMAENSDYNTIENNTANSNAKHGIELMYSDYNLVKNNNASLNKWMGINLSDSSKHNTIENNTANYNSKVGIDLKHSDHNIVKNNTVRLNGINGIKVKNSNYNLIYNNYINNSNNAFDNGNNNRWNISKTPGTNIIGGPYLGGNYWSDYTGSDTDGDGLGDTLLPYTSGGSIKNGGDYCPLVHVDTTPPNPITNLQNTTGNFWINWTWSNPGEDYNHTEVWLDGTLVLWQSNF